MKFLFVVGLAACGPREVCFGDCDVQDSAPVEIPIDGDYAGTLDARSDTEWGGVDCTGPLLLTLDSSGTLAGEMSCERQDLTVVGPVTGSHASGLVQGTWTPEVWGQSYPITFQGTVGDGLLQADLDEDGWIYVDGHLQASRIDPNGDAP